MISSTYQWFRNGIQAPFAAPLYARFGVVPLRPAENLTDLFLDRNRRHRVALGDLEADVHPSLNIAEQVVTLGQLRRIVDGTDEKLAAVGIGTGVRHGHRARRVLREHRFVVELVTGTAPARPQRVAALNNEGRDHTVELEAVVELVAGQEHKVIDRVGSQLGVEAE